MALNFYRHNQSLFWFIILKWIFFQRLIIMTGSFFYKILSRSRENLCSSPKKCALHWNRTLEINWPDVEDCRWGQLLYSYSLSRYRNTPDSCPPFDWLTDLTSSATNNSTAHGQGGELSQKEYLFFERDFLWCVKIKSHQTGPEDLIPDIYLKVVSCECNSWRSIVRLSFVQWSYKYKISFKKIQYFFRHLRGHGFVSHYNDYFITADTWNNFAWITFHEFQ